MSIADANIVLNTAVAKELKGYADELENAEDFDTAVIKLVKRTIRDHKRIIFNGNGYSHEWEQEAEKRGLCNLKSTVDALPCVLERKNIELFEEFGIFSEAEVRARYEVSLENYTKALHIEALTMLDMAKKQIVPAVAAYMGDLADTACSKKALSSALSTRAEETLLAKLSAGADMLVEKSTSCRPPWTALPAATACRRPPATKTGCCRRWPSCARWLMRWSLPRGKTTGPSPLTQIFCSA